MRFTEDYRDWALDQFYCKYLETEDVRFAALAVGTGCSNPPDWALRVLEQAADEHLIGTSNFEDKSGGGRRHEDPLGDGLLLLAVAAWYLLGSTGNAAIRAVTKQTSGETDFRRLHELWKKNSHPVAWQIDGKVVDVENKWTIRARKNGNVKEADVIPYHFRLMRDCVTEFGAQGLELDAVLLAWGTDLNKQRGRWSIAKARGYAKKGRVKDPLQLRINAYRVLMTRGRDATVVFVPPLIELDETYGYLLDSGFLELERDGIKEGTTAP